MKILYRGTLEAYVTYRISDREIRCSRGTVIESDDMDTILGLLATGKFVELPDGAEVSQEEQPCPECGQTDHGQTGEHPCPECGLPTTWDAKEEPVETASEPVEIAPEPKKTTRKAKSK